MWVWVSLTSIVFKQPSNHWLLYFICQNHDKEDFLVLIIFYIFVLLPFPHSNTQISRRNWMQSIIMAAPCIWFQYA